MYDNCAVARHDMLRPARGRDTVPGTVGYDSLTAPGRHRKESVISSRLRNGRPIR